MIVNALSFLSIAGVALDMLNAANDYLWTYVVIVMLVFCALYFTIRLRGVQFRMLKDM